MRACVILGVYVWFVISLLFAAPSLYQLHLYSILFLWIVAAFLLGVVIFLALLPDRHTKE